MAARKLLREEKAEREREMRRLEKEEKRLEEEERDGLFIRVMDAVRDV